MDSLELFAPFELSGAFFVYSGAFLDYLGHFWIFLGHFWIIRGISGILGAFWYISVIFVHFWGIFFLSRAFSAISGAVSYTHLRAHVISEHFVCRLLLETKKFIHLFITI